MTGQGLAVIIDPVSDAPADQGDPGEGPDGAPRRPPWLRPDGGRYLGGVAAGAARWLEVDPLVVRIGIVVGALFWPLVVVVYAGLWLLLPSDVSRRPLLLMVREPGSVQEVFAAVALAGAAVLLLPDLRPGGSLSLQVGIVLVGAGLALLTRADGRVPVATPASRRTRTSRTLPHLPAVRLHRPGPRPSAFLTPVALSLGLLLAGGLAALEWSGMRPASPGTIVSLLMVLIGAVLTVSARWGRARALVLLVPPLLVGWVAFSLTDIPRHPGLGERIYTLTTADDDRTHVLGAGALTVNAQDLPLRPGQRVTIDVSVTAGTIEINVPYDAELRLAGELGIGQAEVWDERVGSYSRQLDTGPTARRRIAERMEAMGPLCYQVDTNDVGGQVPGTTSTVPPSPTTSVVEYQDSYGQPCRPEPPVDAPVITIRFEIGAGGLEVHRVEALD